MSNIIIKQTLSKLIMDSFCLFIFYLVKNSYETVLIETAIIALSGRDGGDTFCTRVKGASVKPLVSIPYFLLFFFSYLKGRQLVENGLLCEEIRF